MLVYVIMAFTTDYARKKSQRARDFFDPITMDKLVPDRAKWWLMIFFSILAVFVYLYCILCGLGDGESVEETSDSFCLGLSVIFKDLLGIMPWFIWGCVVAGFVLKQMHLGKLKLPKSMLSSGLFASILPICSCAAVPMAHGMMLGRQMRVRSVITFLIVVPVLSPIVFILAYSQIGIEYLIVEIVSVFALAMATGIVIERFAGVKNKDDDPKSACTMCEGCTTAQFKKPRASALLGGWDQLMYLLKFILLGVVIGAMLSIFIDSKMLTQVFGTQGDLLGSLPGLVLIVCIAIPIFICSGEDVVILAPLLVAGLPLGHAIAFAIAGNAICVSAIPVLNATFGKKVTVLIFASFFIGSIILGFVINGLVSLFM